MADLSLTNIHKSFGDTKVIHGVDLEVEAGEFTVFVGPSGCGKSTLLRMIAGLESVTNGSVAIGGAEVTHSDPSDRGVTMVFQSYALYPHMSVYDNMAFSLKMNGAGAAEIDSRVRKAADILGLHDLLERKPKALSGGQRQRVALARALLRDPLVYLLDEPMSNLDAQLREDLRPQLRRLMIGGEQPVVYVTHDQQEAMALADRIAVMREGRIEQIGTPRELYLQPASTYVAQFIGRPQMNLLPARDGVITGIRPDDLRLDPAGSPCTILSREWFGANQMLLVRCDRGDLRLVCPGETAIGAEPRISWSSICEHRFDAVSGRRLPSNRLPSD